MIGVWLVACQQVEPPSIDGPPSGWRVIERVGDVRVTERNGGTPRAGDLVADGSRIATGKAGRIILKNNGVQLTVGVGASLILPAREPAADLVQEAGWIRYRLATPVNAAFGVTTSGLTLHASAGVVDVRVDQGATRVTVDSGLVDITTRAGHHQARLAAGASARADDQAGGRLMVRTAPDREYKPIAPLASPTRERPGRTVRAASFAARPTPDAVRSDTRAAADNPSPARRQEVITLAVRTEPRRSEVPGSPAILATPRPPAPSSRLPAPSKSDIDGNRETRASMTTARPEDRAADPLTRKFDRLVEGLVADLPTARPDAD